MCVPLIYTSIHEQTHCPGISVLSFHCSNARATTIRCRGPSKLAINHRGSKYAAPHSCKGTATGSLSWRWLPSAGSRLAAFPEPGNELEAV